MFVFFIINTFINVYYYGRWSREQETTAQTSMFDAEVDDETIH